MNDLKEKKIVYTNTGMYITNYVKSPRLEKLNGIWNKQCHRYDPINGFHVKEEGVYLTYPINQNMIQNLFPHHLVETIPPNPSKYIGDKAYSEIKLKPAQEEIVKQIVDLNKKKVYLNLPTGFGKTVLSIYLTMNIHKTRSLILCPSKKILKQWESKYESMTSMNMHNILNLDKSNIIDKIMNDEMDETVDNTYIYLCTEALLDSYAKRRGWLSLNQLMLKLGIGVLFIDEAHRNLGRYIKILAVTSIPNIYYLSAEFKLAGILQSQKFVNVFTNIPIITPPPAPSDQKEEELSHIRCLVVKYDSEPSISEEADISKGPYGYNMNKAASYELRKGVLYTIAADLMRRTLKRVKPGRRILWMTTSIEGVDTYYDLVKKDFPDKIVLRYHSNMTQEERELIDTEDYDILVTTFQSLSYGYDRPGIQFVFALDSVNEIWDNQAAGRARKIPGEDCYYIMFIDGGFARNKKNLNKRLNYILKSNCKSVHEMQY